MKRVLQYLVCNICILGFNQASAQNISTSLGTGWFPEGVYPVINTFTVEQPPNGSVVALFVLKTASGKTITFKPDAKFSNGITADFDMGSAEPGSKVAVYFVSLTNDPLGSAIKELQIIPKSAWLKDATISQVSVAGKNIAMVAEYPISAISQGLIPNDVTAIGGKSFGLNSNVLEFGINYSIDNRTSKVSDPGIKFNLNILDQKVTLQQFALPDTNVSLDTNFDLALVAEAHQDSKTFEIKFRKVKIPLSPPFSARFDAGLKLFGRLSGHIYYGQYDGEWGFVENGDKSTRVTAVLNGLGYVRGGIDVFGGLGSAFARLEAYGRIGGGFQYTSLPKDTVTNLFGGSIDINGWLDIETFWGFGPGWSFGPKTFLSKSFGKLPQSVIGVFADSTSAIVATTYKVPADVITTHPQPTIFSKSNQTGMNWIANQGLEGELLLSVLDENTNSFKNPVTITKNRNSICEPQSAFYNDGSVLTVWTQNKFTEETIPANATLTDLFNGQDIMASYYNKATGLVSVIPGISEQDVADGKPAITIRPADEHALILWLSQVNGENTIRFTTISKINGNLELGESKVLASGANKDVQVSFFDSDKALAVWINDPDNNEETSDDRIMGAIWNGQLWSEPQVIVASGTNTEFKNLVLQ